MHPSNAASCFEFNVRVLNYAERHVFASEDPLPSDIHHLLWGNYNTGLNLELIGYGTSRTVLLQLCQLP